jgi:hypothetical protein
MFSEASIQDAKAPRKASGSKKEPSSFSKHVLDYRVMYAIAVLLAPVESGVLIRISDLISRSATLDRMGKFFALDKFLTAHNFHASFQLCVRNFGNSATVTWILLGLYRSNSGVEMRTRSTVTSASGKRESRLEILSVMAVELKKGEKINKWYCTRCRYGITF